MRSGREVSGGFFILYFCIRIFAFDRGRIFSVRKMYEMGVAKALSADSIGDLLWVLLSTVRVAGGHFHSGELYGSGRHGQDGREKEGFPCCCRHPFECGAARIFQIL